MTVNDVLPGNNAFSETAILDKKAINGLSGGPRQHVVASPYTEAAHLLDLDTLDAENQMLAEALLDLRCLRDDYATAAYLETFNWEEVVGRVRELAAARKHCWRETSWYIVAFRSRYIEGIDYGHLGDLDKAAHAEATASGGFLKYWFGTPDRNLRNLATCIWRNREDARRGGTGPAHKEAIKAVRTMYAEWRIDQHRLIIRDGLSSWEMIEWTG
ncbi:uncharacterized protein J7T55_007032 [Diaporthe amygdali]|uniref:uncharacterized protein n=1 Tax=Phomopsis amygdali TaxID=1214568 RepID=UPI0022FEF587|nr:uncharacterized protein J7T55_007032 [Diaporthe amygdali]KAJ0104106.1 uncharacterized protein J7T55_007032 [Diaporthe amygdali]